MYCTLDLYVPSLLSDACFFLPTSLPNASTPPYSYSQFKKAHTVIITPNLQNSLGGQYEGIFLLGHVLSESRPQSLPGPCCTCCDS